MFYDLIFEIITNNYKKSFQTKRSNNFVKIKKDKNCNLIKKIKDENDINNILDEALNEILDW